ncbi:MAG TPA: isochorismate synthase, partial [Nannocystis exedens]|nr:isochorismate synthase [Nannocystis exedens]
MTASPHDMQTPPKGPDKRPADRVAGVDAWDYLPLVQDHEIAFVWSRGDLRIVALGAARPGEKQASAPRPCEIGGCSFTGAAGRDEWTGWPGSWRARPRTIYASRCSGEVWRLGDPNAPSRPPTSLDPWTAIAQSSFSPVESEPSWKITTRAATQAIATGAAEKVVLARREVARSPRASARAASLLPLLRRDNNEAVTFGVKLGKRGWFVGASPETLIELEDGWLQTEALAGTHRSPEGLQNAKDIGEHRWVIDGIAAALDPVCTGLEQLGPRSKRAGHLYHWQTRFRGRVAPGHGLFDLAGRLHPTAAVGGTPRAAALDFIAAHEPRDRGWYAGFTGWVGPRRDGHAIVGLRSALLRDDSIYIYAGAGIVAASDPNNEWIETAAKLETCKPSLAGQGVNV